MTPSATDPARPVLDIAGKRLESDLDKLHDCACKNRAARRAQQSTDNGKEANTEDHGKETNATKKLKRYNGFAIDINKEPHHDDSYIESPPATAGGKRSVPHRAVSSLEIQKKELELDARRLRLEQKRAKWAIASWRKDMELEKMRLENERMKLANKQLQVKIKHRALELGMELEMI
nr:uncharacterized protein LOC127329134 [Lolium perenne]